MGQSAGAGAGQIVRYSDYIIYADESGDPNPASVDRNYSVFVLNFCVFRKDDYAASALPAVAAFKFAHFGHDMVVLHENEIRLQKPPFVFLRDERKRDLFMEGMARIIREVDFTIIAVVVDKRRLGYRYVLATEVYELALGACIERLHRFLGARGEGNRMAHIVIESRGKGGDGELENAFQRIRHGKNPEDKTKTGLEIRFADKKANSTGLQIADLTARPIGVHFIKPEQSNRAWDSLQPKLLRSPKGDVDGWGLTMLP